MKNGCFNGVIPTSKDESAVKGLVNFPIALIFGIGAIT